MSAIDLTLDECSVCSGRLNLTGYYDTGERGVSVVLCVPFGHTNIRSTKWIENALRERPLCPFGNFQDLCRADACALWDSDNMECGLIRRS